MARPELALAYFGALALATALLVILATVRWGSLAGMATVFLCNLSIGLSLNAPDRVCNDDLDCIPGGRWPWIAVIREIVEAVFLSLWVFHLIWLAIGLGCLALGLRIRRQGGDLR